jgi:hypothetical protein
LIFPIGQADPLQAEFVIAIEWVGDKFVAQQIGLHYAGNLGGMPLLDVWLLAVAYESDNVSGGAKLPARIQVSRGRFGGVEGQCC